MSRVIQAAEFFVVGGPVQPDRPCYIERPADHLLEIALQSQRCCCVLGPRATGKSSLMGRVARTLRQRGELVAAVDLAQIGARGESLDADRWVYGIANKLAHELRLTEDLRGWWDEQNALLSEHRLAEFLWDLVLTNTAVPVTVFVDEIEQAVSLPFATELFGAIEACYSRREAEPDYARVNFVLLGVVSPGALGADSPSSPLAAAAQIELPDFVPEQAYRLAMGFGGEPAHAQALMDRVLAWTGGHPYLTQKVARGVTRKNGRLEDVEHVVRDQLLAAAASRDEPLLNHIRSQLTARDPSTRAALKLLGAVARGAHVAAGARPAAVEVLKLSGVVSVDADRRLVYRNRIFKEAFGRRWVRSARPTRWLAWSAAAVLVAAAVLAGYYWYAQFLPQPYLRVLGDPAATQQAATAAYEHLRVLPGFAEEAERLFAAALERRAAAAESFDELMTADTALRALPGGAAAADGLRAQFWLRRAKAAAAAERRSAALLLAQRAATQPQTPAGAAGRAMVAELLGDDYARLARTVSLEPRPTDWSVDWSRTGLILLGAEHRVSLASLGEPTGGAAGVSGAPVELTALQHAPLVRELTVDDGGSAGAFTLEITLMHPAVNELLITLAAPSGVQANVALSPRDSDNPTYRFVADGRSPLATLADEDRSGIWRLRIVDRRVDQAGELASWRLTFGEQSWTDEAEAPVPIPDASRTSQVTVNVDSSGKFAIVQPSAPSVIGAVSLWNLAEARLANDFTLPAPARYVALNAPATRLAVVSADSLSLWNVVNGLPVARLATQTQFVLPPVFSTEGRYLAIAESVEAAAPLVSILRAENGALVTSVAGLDGVRGWWLGPDAGYLAMRTTAHVVRVIDPRRGSELAVLRHGREVERVVPLPSGDVVVTIDAAGAIRAWDLPTARAGAVTPRLLGTARDPAEVSVAADGSRLAYTSADGSVAVLALPSGATVCNLRLPSMTPPTQPRLAPDGGALATESGTDFRLWQLPSGTAPAAPVTDLSPVNVTALAVGRDSDRVVAGFLAGQLRVLANLGDAERTSASGLDFFGHGGPVESIAVNAEHDVIATGGDDGAVRLWDLATGAPVGLPMHRAGVSRQVPVTAVALSDDGRRVAGAAGSAVRVWQVKDAVLSAEIAVDGAATAVDFAPDGRRLAIGDDTGALRVAALDGGEEARASLQAGIRSLAFTADGALIVAGDADGRVQLVRAAGVVPIGAPVRLPGSIRWVGVSPDGSTAFAATDFWLHRFAVRLSGLEPLDARLPELRPAGAAFAALDDSRIRLAGFDGNGRLGTGIVDFSAAAGALAEAGATDRDFTVALGVRLDAAGRVVAAP